MSIPVTKQLHELSQVELSDLLVQTTRQFVDALKNDSPVDELQLLRDYLTAIRNEIRRNEGRREDREGFVL